MTIESRRFFLKTAAALATAVGCQNEGNKEPKVAETPKTETPKTETPKTETQREELRRALKKSFKPHPDDKKDFGPYDQKALDTVIEYSQPHIEKEVKKALDFAIKMRKDAISSANANNFTEFSAEELKLLRQTLTSLSDDNVYSPVRKYVESKKFSGKKPVDRELAVHLTAVHSMKTVLDTYSRLMTKFALIIDAKVEEKKAKGIEVTEDELWEKLESNPSIKAALDLYEKNIEKSPKIIKEYENNFKQWIDRNIDALN